MYAFFFLFVTGRNSKILDREFGYWAEQIPAIESPLCAVVDPMRDYRWHSLRCGGPDVAAFLCEMEGLYFVCHVLSVNLHIRLNYSV